MKIKLKIISLISYSIIVLKGQMIGLPLAFWLLLVSFDIGNSNQVFAILGIVGVVINFTKFGKLSLGKILSFILMVLPIVKRLIDVPLNQFKNFTFLIPLSGFVIIYFLYVFKTEE